jgi:hypothetical protein
MSKKSFRNIGTEAASKFISPITQYNSPNSLNAIEQSGDTLVVVKPMVVNDQQRWKDKFRTTTVLEDDVKQYLDVMVRLDGVSITKYLNKLVHDDMAVREEEYEEAKKLLKEVVR